MLRANQVVLDPVANVVKAMPAPLLNRVRDLDDNLKEPRIFANDILQGRWNAAGITFERFVFNSIFGLGGLVDVATPGGLPMQTGDFGQTMFVWGVTAGPYVEQPYYGPSTLRDSFGGAVDTVADPLGWVVGGVDQLAGRGPSARLLCRRQLILANGKRLRTPRSTSTPSCARTITRPAGGSCARRSVCRPSPSSPATGQGR